MKMNKCAYLFAAALVASTVGMTSCSNEEVAGIEQGVENKVTLTMSVANRATRATADEVNMGSTMQKISNIAVVPMIGESYLNPIIMGDLSSFSNGAGGNTGTLTKTTALNSKINRFKVYGNIDAVDGGNAFDENKTFTGFKISVKDSGTDLQMSGGTTHDLFNSHGLYYYAYAGENANNKIQVSTVAEGTGELTSLEPNAPIASNPYVKISGVNYAVGVLVTAVFNADDQTQYISTVSGDAKEVVNNDNVKFKGIVITKQSKTLDQDFEQVGEDLVYIYDDQLNTSGSDIKAKDAPAISMSSNKSQANIYTIVAATGDKEDVGDIISGYLQFELQSGYKLTLKNGSEIVADGSAKVFYLPFSLKPQDTDDKKAVFMKDYSTFFNARVKNWGLATENPDEVTDVNLAVEVNIDWQEGIIYDVEI